MEENKNFEEKEKVVDETTQKTFTQEELNSIVGERVAKVKSKYSDYDDLKQKAEMVETLQEENKKISELQKQLDEANKTNTIRTIKDKVSEETGVPQNLLVGETEESMRTHAEGILNFINKKGGYPKVSDKGEVVTPKKATKDSILSIKNEKERLKAIESNIDLFK